MFSHICIGTADVPRARAFLADVLAPLGVRFRFVDAAGRFVTFEGPAGGRPLLFVGRPFDGGPAAPGNGNMVALLARDRASVDACHARAIALGGRDEGAPGLRPHYHPNYYGAYFRDLDGNKFCVACHEAE